MNFTAHSSDLPVTQIKLKNFNMVTYKRTHNKSIDDDVLTPTEKKRKHIASIESFLWAAFPPAGNQF